MQSYGRGVGKSCPFCEGGVKGTGYALLKSKNAEWWLLTKRLSETGGMGRWMCVPKLKTWGFRTMRSLRDRCWGECISERRLARRGLLHVPAIVLQGRIVIHGLEFIINRLVAMMIALILYVFYN